MPEERLTIEGVLEHPWLNCTEALDNVLPSAQMMMDKVGLDGWTEMESIYIALCLKALHRASHTFTGL